MGKLSEHFLESEFQCTCCRKLPPDGPDDRLLDALEALRAVVRRPVYLTSGYRCPRHNMSIGGVKNSLHMAGQAADITCPGVPTAFLYMIAESLGLFGGIGFYPDQNFVHVDVGKVSRWGQLRNKKKLVLDKALVKLGQIC